MQKFVLSINKDYGKLVETDDIPPSICGLHYIAIATPSLLQSNEVGSTCPDSDII
jgi:hypothetical protein